MSRNADLYSIPSIRIVLSPNSIAKVGPIPGQLATSIKLAAGGTLEIGGPSMTSFSVGITVTQGGGTFLTGQTFGQMYALSTNEVFSGNVSGSFYLYASGATCEVMVALGRSQGSEG